MKIKKKKGFTLIELLIVVAIIAILAAIAIPQFAQYRMRGYNAAANSDLRNAKTAEEALFADYQAYGDSAGLATKSPVTLTTQDFAGTARTINSSLSSNVYMAAKTDAAAGGRGTNYTVVSKHQQGDRVFGADGDSTALFWCQGTAGSNLQSTGVTSTTANDLTTTGDATDCNPAVFGQL